MKKKTSIIRILTKRSFQANRSRNIVAIIAIILTTLMFTSLFVLSESMVQNIQHMYFLQAGYNSHLSTSLLTAEETEKITAHEAVCDWGETVVVGIAENEALSGRQVEIRYADTNYASSAFSLPTTGKMPLAADEIALDTITLDKLGLPYEFGQTITLKWRKNTTEADYISSEFTLVGYWDGNDAAMASMAWVSEAFLKNVCTDIDQETQRANNQILGLSQLHIDLYADSNLDETCTQMLSDLGLETASFSPNPAYDATVSQNILFEVIPMLLCMILVFASGYLIIYNIFQISVASDICFYGKLKTLGTSRKQIKRLIYGQANRLSLIGIPIGLFLGFLLGAILVPLMITGTGSKAYVSINFYVFAGSATFAYLTVLFSCMKPAKIAGKVSPMEALRYTDAESASLRKKEKKSNSTSLLQMAAANLGRNRKRTATVLCSLTLGLLLLTCIYAKNACFDIDKYMSHTVISDFAVKDSSIASYIKTYNPYGTTISKDLLTRIQSLDGLEKTGQLYSQVYTHEIDDSALSNIETYYQKDDRLLYIETTDEGLYEAYQDMIETQSCTTVLYGVDGLILDVFSEEYNILDGNFNKEAFLSGSYVITEAAAGAEESEKETQPTYSVGDMVTIHGKKYEVMAIVANISPITEGTNSSTPEFLSFYLPADVFQEIYPDNTLRKFFFDVSEESHPQAEQMLLDYQNSVDKSLTFSSKSTLTEHYKEQTRANTIMGFSLSIIIAFVGILNFINSMVTAIVSRKREFAMMQSIGMTKRQLRRMLIHEGLLYAIISLLLSYLLSIPAVTVGVRTMIAGDWTATYHFTILPLIICTPVLIGLAVLIPYLCFKNLEKQSIVERLRQEN